MVPHRAAQGGIWIQLGKEQGSLSNTFLEVGVLCFNVWECSCNSCCFQPGDWGLAMEELLCIFHGYHFPILLLCHFLLHKACFACIFSELINPVLSEEVQVSGNKLGVPKLPPWLWWGIEKMNLHWYQKRIVIDKALGGILYLCLVFIKEIWCFSSHHTNLVCACLQGT